MTSLDKVLSVLGDDKLTQREISSLAQLPTGAVSTALRRLGDKNKIISEDSPNGVVYFTPKLFLLEKYWNCRQPSHI